MNERAAKLPLKWRDSVSGALVVDKPAGITSFRTVEKVKRMTGSSRVGHTGTLDPHATGVLVLLFNKATKLAAFLTNSDKRYHLVVKLGEETDTQDAEGKVVATYHGEPRPEEEIREAAARFVGEIRQKVPLFSAAKHKGRPLYYWTRKGVEVDTPEKDVTIHSLDVLGVDWPEVTMEVSCSSGTYMRTLASDLGAALGVGGHLLRLERLAAGALTLDDALTLDEVGDLFRSGALRERLISMSDALGSLPALEIDPSAALMLTRGVRLKPGQVASSLRLLGDYEGPVRVVCQNRLAAVYKVKKSPSGLWKLDSVRVLKEAW